MTIGGLRLGKGLAWGLPIAALVAVLDQLSKWKILCLMRPEGVMETPFIGKGVIQALPFLDLVMAWNRGVSFGMGNNSGGWNVVVFTAVAAVVGGMLVAWMARTSNRLILVALGLVVGGAIGNVIDRVRFGAVVDFLYVHIGAFDWWPAFNVADSAICVGAGLLIFDSLFGL